MDVAGPRDEQVALRLTRSLLRPNGALVTTPLAGYAVRSTLLAELALSGALTRASGPSEAAQVAVDPTGFEPLDRLLAAIAAEPHQAVVWWVRKGPVGTRDLAEALVADGIWKAKSAFGLHHYVDASPSSLTTEREQVEAVLNGFKRSEPTAVLAVIARSIGLTGVKGQRSDSDIALDCGSAEWLIAEVGAYLRSEAALAYAIGRAGQMAITGPRWPKLLTRTAAHALRGKPVFQLPTTVSVPWIVLMAFPELSSPIQKMVNVPTVSGA